MNTVTSVRVLQTVAMTVGTALLLWSVGVPTIFRHAEAASITNASDTLSNSAPSAGSNHTIEFETENGLSTNQNFTVEFAAAFDTSAIDINDVDLLINGNATTTNSGAPGAGAWGVTGLGTDILTFTTPTNMGVASSSEIMVRIGTHASVGGTGDEQIINPAATTSYPIDIDGTMQDAGQLRVAIVDQVLVTASVDTSLTFTVSGVDASQPTNGSTSTAATSTSTALPFGTLVIGETKALAQDLSVVTNAANGFVVTVEQTGNLQSSTGADIDGFIDGAYTNDPTTWTTPAGTLANPDTYGHWGLTTNDTSTGNIGGEFGANEWVAASTTPTPVMAHTGPSDGTTLGSGAARVAYQIQITALQEAGDDYNTTLRYIATPTF